MIPAATALVRSSSRSSAGVVGALMIPALVGVRRVSGKGGDWGTHGFIPEIVPHRDATPSHAGRVGEGPGRMPESLWLTPRHRTALIARISESEPANPLSKQPKLNRTS